MIATPPASAEDPQDEIATLIRRLHETQQRLQELAGGEVDAVMLPGGQSFLLHDAQEKLRASEASEHRLAVTQEAILNALPAHIALLDAQGVILSVNEAWKRFSTANSLQGPDFFTGHNYLEICERAQGDCANEAQAPAAGIRRVLRGEIADFSIEYPCHSPTEQRWFRLMVTPLREDRLAGAVVTHFDITERKLAELAALRLAAIVEFSDDAIIGKDLGSIVTSWNRGAEKVFGYSSAEMVGTSIERLIPPDRQGDENQILSKIRRGESVEHFETVRQTRDGRRIHVSLTVSPIKDEHGAITGFSKVARDITERKHSEERMRRLVESDVQGIIFWNRQGEITEANDAFLKMVGCTRDDLAAGRINWREMTPPEFAEQDARALREIDATGVCKAYEKEYLRHDGSRVPIFIGAAIFESNPEEGVSFVLDLTERKKLEHQFLRAQRMESIGTLAGGIAHDLNNALGPIMMSLDLLEMRFPDPKSLELLSIISASAQHAADMVRQVLSFARGVEGRQMEVQVNHLLGEIERIARDTFPKNIRVQTILPHDLWPVTGDPTQLHQVLLNLCVNARDAMPDGGTLTLSAKNLTLDAHYAGLSWNLEARPGPHIFIEITDTGTGIPPEIQEKIFDPFFTTKEIGKGTGLGLSTALAILKSHGGFIRVDSEPGKGTKFNVYLPAQTEISPEAEKRVAEMPRGHGELILVVDDEAAVRQITQRTLIAFGYRVVLATDGVEALAVFTREGGEISAVLTDMMMPVMDGPAVIRVLRKLNPKLPIIAASGLSTDAHTATATSLGVKHFLSKPYTAEALLKVLKQVLPTKV